MWWKRALYEATLQGSTTNVVNTSTACRIEEKQVCAMQVNANNVCGTQS